MQVYDNKRHTYEDNKWIASTYEQLFNDFLKRMNPPPTVIIMNQNFWILPPHKSMIKNDLPRIMKIALELVDVVLWQRGTPTLDDINNHNFDYSDIDSYVKDVVCNKDHDKSVKVFKNGVHYYCTFVDFPSNTLTRLYQEGRKKYYGDNRRFVDSSVYYERNEATVKAAGLDHIANVLVVNS